MNITPFIDDSMHSMLIAPDDHDVHHFRHNSRSYPRASHHHNPRHTVSMSDLYIDNSMISENSSHDEDNEDAPATPPSTSKSMFTSPPEVPRQGRPINRRLFLQEAQERLSLPDIFTSRANPKNSRVLAHRTRMMQQRHLSRPSMVALQPRTVSWGNSFDDIQHGHSISQRSFSVTNPAEF
jgi:hypothetical protein